MKSFEELIKVLTEPKATPDPSKEKVNPEKQYAEMRERISKLSNAALVDMLTLNHLAIIKYSDELPLSIAMPALLVSELTSAILRREGA